MSKASSIVRKFRTTFLLIAVLPVILFGAITYFYIRTSTIRDKEQALSASIETKREVIRSWLEEINARSTPFRNIPEYTFLLRRKLEQDTSGRSVSAIQAAEDMLDLAIRRKLTSTSPYSGIYLLKSDGSLTYSYAKEITPVRRFYTSDDFFQRGRDQEFSSDALVSPFTSNKAIFLSNPIRDQGTVIGVLILEVTLEGLTNAIINRAERADIGDVLLLDERGSVLIDSKGTMFNNEQRKITDGIEAARLGKDAIGIFEDSQGNSVIGAYIWVPEKKWVLALELPTAEALRSVNLLLYANIVLVLIITIVIIVLARFYANKFADPIISITRSASLVAKGDLREKVSLISGDEIGILASSFNSMVESLASINRQMLMMEERIREATSGIQSATENQERVAMQQSSAVSETSATIEQLSVSAKQVAQSAQSIMRQVEGTAAKIVFLSQKAQEINKISVVIEDVAHQIHLLSLNASIEAARAGEHGKGFGVVASEIRKLSEKSNKQTADITRIVSDIQEAISSVVMATEQAVNGVRSITVSVQEQDTATDQISQSMHEINNAMRDGIAATKHTIHSVEQLTSVMSEMNALVQQFKID